MTQTARTLLHLALAFGALQGCANDPGPQAQGPEEGGSGLSVHGTGRALDVMLPTWNPDHDPRARCYGGEHPHNDHVHVELTLQAGEKGTPFFNGGNVVPPSPDQSAPGGDVGQGADCPDEDRDGYCDDAQVGADQGGQDAGGYCDTGVCYWNI